MLTVEGGVKKMKLREFFVCELDSILRLTPVFYPPNVAELPM
jgi:hypothetical protein